VKFPSSFLEKFDNINQAYYHAEKLFRVKHNFSSLACLGGEFFIISPIVVKEPFLDSFASSEGIPIEQTEECLQLDLANQDHVDVFSDLLYQSLTHSLINAGYTVKGTTAIDASNNLIDWVRNSTTDKTFRKLRPFISLFPAFNFGLRKFGNDFFVQISPRSVIDYNKDIHSLLAEGVFAPDELRRSIENVSLPIGRTAKLYSILDIDAADSINEKPFNGASFLVFAEKMYPYLTFAHREAKLILVLPFGNRSSPWYFSSELVKPTVRFSDLSSWDHDFYAKLGSEMKAHSARRYEFIEGYLRKIKFRFFDVDLNLSDPFYHEIGRVVLEPSDFSKTDLQLFEFSSPWLSFRDRESGRVVDVRRDSTPYWGATVDLLNHDELACFDSPPDIKLKVIADASLFADTCHLMDVLKNGFGAYKGFEHIFKTKMSFEVSSTEDLLSKQPYTNISPANYDCALIFGPRRLPEGSEESKKIYTFPETEILNKGVPVQFITNDPSQNKTYDKSLRTKSNDPNALFGISLNILGKIGATVMKLSPKTTDYFLPNSIVLGFNISRIFLPLSKDISQEKSPRELVRTSTPLAAPLVIMTRDGAEIITQAVYELPNETALFKEDRAERIINDLPTEYNTVIIHKDGPFYPDEIADLKEIQQKQRSIIPVSIVSSHSPRLFSSVVTWNKVPRTGTVMKLSGVDFLMVNSLVTQRYSPASRGWPNTILVTIHEEALGERKLTASEKRQILFQIWALTRVHLGSQLPTRKPISIHYSDSLATFLRKAGNIAPEYFSNFGTVRNRHGYVARIFL
jgi:hypothetical protein